jgi:hypothetical protein
MSARNGDKSRFGRQRKQKIRRRVELRALRPQKPVAGEAAAPGSQPESGTGPESEGVLTGAARIIGSALGTIAAETHLATGPSEVQASEHQE